jgi:stearoyl-CoA desaturase (delta-9 desaturase)
MGRFQPGGAGLLRRYAVPVKGDGGSDKWKEASWAFNGGVNKHSQVARRKLRELSVALLTTT